MLEVYGWDALGCMLNKVYMCTNNCRTFLFPLVVDRDKVCMWWTVYLNKYRFFFNEWQCSSLVVPIFSDLWATYLQHGVEKTFTISFLFLKMHCLWCGRESIIIFLFPFRRRTPKSISDKICTVVSKVYSQYKIILY